MRPALLLLALLATKAQAQWTLQPSGTTASLRGIHAVSDQIAWASGSSGTVLHTTDGGAHWLPCVTPPQADHLDFRGIQAFDAQTAIVMSSGKGDLSRLYKTIDACQSWTLLFTNPDPEGFWDGLSVNPHSAKTPVVPDSRNWVEWSGQAAIVLGDPVEGTFALWGFDATGMSPHAVPERWAHRPAPKTNDAAFAASNSSLFRGLHGLDRNRRC